MTESHALACAIIVAGGVGHRAIGAGLPETQTIPKQYQMLGGRPILAWSIAAFADHPAFSHIVVVCAPEYRAFVQEMAGTNALIFTDAGATRTASVRNGLETAKQTGAHSAFIHDAARPGLNTATLDTLLAALRNGFDGAAPTLAVADALWHHENFSLTGNQDRTNLLRVQTPQAFVLSQICVAYDALLDQQELADDIAVARLSGLNVVGIAGGAHLDKITYPQDFARMTQILVPALLPRTGSGIDAHKFSAGDFVTLCGVQIPHTHGLAGHSDADVGWHALADAIYGALSAGDIGHHFPPSDDRWKGAASSIFLAHASAMVKASGGMINHVDVTLVCEAPKIGPNRAAMIAATATLLGLREDQVSIKATTTEGMGFTGRREGIAAQATATIMLPETFRAAMSVVPTP